MERLGDVIVGAGIKTLHLVAPTVARGKDEDRHGAAGTAPRFQHRDAVHFRQADIEDHGVIWLAFAEIMPLLAIEGTIYDIAGVSQRGRQLPIHVRIVFNNKEAQNVSSAYRSPTS